MGRGLGELQRAVIDVLRYEQAKRKGWYDVGSLIYQVYNGVGCFERSGFENLPKRPDESAHQSVWRAIRTLEKRGLITSRMRVLTPLEQYGNARRSKDVKLSVQFNSKMN